MVSCQQGSLPVVYPPRLDFQCTGLCQSSGFIDAGSYGSCIGYMSVCRNGDVFPRGDGFVVFQAACAEVCISFAVDGAAVFRSPFQSRVRLSSALHVPLLLTPSPFSVPTKVIRPAYMPPMAAVSRAKAGCPPFPSMAEASRVFASTVLAVVIWRSLPRCLR